MKNIVGVYLAGDSTGEAPHSGRIYDQQFSVSHVVPLACYSLLFSMYVQADTLGRTGEACVFLLSLYLAQSNLFFGCRHDLRESDRRIN